MGWKILRFGDSDKISDIMKPLLEIGEIVTVPQDKEALKKAIVDVDAVCASLRIRLDREVLECAKQLRVISTSSTGRDHIDLDYAAERGIEVLSLKDDTEFLMKITCTAEMAWALMLAVNRRLPWSFDAAKRGEWQVSGKYRGHQLSGKTLGVLGYGRLGRILAPYGLAFGMRVIACDVRDVTPDDPRITMVDFDTLLRESDVLSIHIHMTEENRNLLGREEFAKMKQDALLMNTSRGGIIDEEALIEALESGKLWGAGLDVIHGEWREDMTEHPLIKYANTHQNLVISTHLGGVTFESQPMAGAHTIQKLKKYLESQEPAPA